MKQKTITATTTAWLPSHSSASVLDDKPENALNALAFTHYDMTDQWARVGTAEITVTLDPPSEVVGRQVAILREALRDHRAKAEREQQAIQRQINELLAIENTTTTEGE